MSLPITLVLFAASAGLAVFSHLMGARRHDRMDPPLLPVPWTAMQILAVFVCILLAAHLVSLAMGAPLKSRFLS